MNGPPETAHVERNTHVECSSSPERKLSLLGSRFSRSPRRRSSQDSETTNCGDSKLVGSPRRNKLRSSLGRLTRRSRPSHGDHSDTMVDEDLGDLERTLVLQERQISQHEVEKKELQEKAEALLNRQRHWSQSEQELMLEQHQLELTQARAQANEQMERLQENHQRELKSLREQNESAHDITVKKSRLIARTAARQLAQLRREVAELKAHNQQDPATDNMLRDASVVGDMTYDPRDEEIRKLRAELADVRSALQQKEQTVSDMTNHLKGLQTSALLLKTSLEKTQNRAKALAEERDSLEAEKQALLLAHKREMEEERKQAEKKQRAMRKSSQQQKSKLVTTLNGVCRAIREQQAIIADLEKECTAYRARDFMQKKKRENRRTRKLSNMLVYTTQITKAAQQDHMLGDDDWDESEQDEIISDISFDMTVIDEWKRTERDDVPKGCTPRRDLVEDRLDGLVAPTNREEKEHDCSFIIDGCGNRRQTALRAVDDDLSGGPAGDTPDQPGVHWDGELQSVFDSTVESLLTVELGTDQVSSSGNISKADMKRLLASSVSRGVLSTGLPDNDGNESTSSDVIATNDLSSRETNHDQIDEPSSNTNNSPSSTGANTSASSGDDAADQDLALPSDPVLAKSSQDPSPEQSESSKNMIAKVLENPELWNKFRKRMSDAGNTSNLGSLVYLRGFLDENNDDFVDEESD